MNLLELQSSLKDLLKEGQPFNVEAIPSHPLKGLWHDPETNRVFKIIHIYEHTVSFYEGFLEDNLPTFFDYLRTGNKWCFESDILTSKLQAIPQ